MIFSFKLFCGLIMKWV